MGAKRSILIEILGLPLAVRVDSARPHDVSVGRDLLADHLPGLPLIQAIVADRGYRGLAKLASRKHVKLEIKARPKGASGFTPLVPLYRVEHALARLGRWRWLSRCYEGTEASARARLEVARSPTSSAGCESSRPDLARLIADGASADTVAVSGTQRERLRWSFELGGASHELDLLVDLAPSTVTVVVDGRVLTKVDKPTPERPWIEQTLDVAGETAVLAVTSGEAIQSDLFVRGVSLIDGRSLDDARAAAPTPVRGYARWFGDFGAWKRRPSRGDLAGEIIVLVVGGVILTALRGRRGVRSIAPSEAPSSSAQSWSRGRRRSSPGSKEWPG